MYTKPPKRYFELTKPPKTCTFSRNHRQMDRFGVKMLVWCENVGFHCENVDFTAKCAFSL